jgi:hypothetical protein
MRAIAMPGAGEVRIKIVTNVVAVNATQYLIFGRR